MVTAVRISDAVEDRAQIVEPIHANQGRLEGIAKLIIDLEELLKLLLKSLPRIKPWQRQLADHLAEIDRRVQVLRMSILMDREDAEILQDADALRASCRAATHALAGSRASTTTRAALKLAADLAGSVSAAMKQHSESTA
jgi:hypothetical protein